jgi:hypothetical protein
MPLPPKKKKYVSGGGRSQTLKEIKIDLTK